MRYSHVFVLVFLYSLLPIGVTHGSGDLDVAGTTTTKALVSSEANIGQLRVNTLNCTTMANGGALTTDASGLLSCSDDDTGVTLDMAYDAGGSGAGRTITADGGAVVIEGTGGLMLDTGSLLQTPGDPVLAGSLTVGKPHRIHVSGRYAYVIDQTSDLFRVIDVTDPANPVQVGSLGIGTTSQSLYVAGRYAYVLDQDSDDLKIIDVSDPSTPVETGSLVLEDLMEEIFVSGRYAYVTDTDSEDLKVIDISDPTNPVLAGSLGIGGFPYDLFVAGRYAYVIDWHSNDLKVIDISGAELTSLMAHSLEAGNLQVRNDIVAHGHLQVSGGVNVGAGGIFTDGDLGVDGDVMINGDLDITGSCTGCTSDVQLKQNVQLLTNALDRVSQLRGVSYDWRSDVREARYYPGEQIGVLGQDVEAVFPELVGTDSRGYKFVRYQKLVAPLIEAVKELKSDNETLMEAIKALKTDNELLRDKNGATERRLAALERGLTNP